MSYPDVLFYVFAALAAVSALVVVFARNVVYAAFSLLFTFLGVAGIYVLLHADFLAVAQIMIYIGGILVLLIFGVMLTTRVTNVDLPGGVLKTMPATIVSGILLGTLLRLVTRASWFVEPELPSPEGTTAAIGDRLVTTHLLPFEVAGILLLVTIMGAALIARTNGRRRDA
ncbi:MAG: NADH-quinone oxidoreductase subunit J [Bacteroidota bacterium]|nr:NADH-quinone oxidoreductase subunit J [Bacteroidota bacterium]